MMLWHTWSCTTTQCLGSAFLKHDNSKLAVQTYKTKLHNKFAIILNK